MAAVATFLENLFLRWAAYLFDTKKRACKSWLALSYLVFLAHVLTDRTLVSLRTRWIKTIPCCRQSSWLASMLHLHTRNLQCDSKWRLLWSQNEAWPVDSSLNYAKDKVHVNILGQKELYSFCISHSFLILIHTRTCLESELHPWIFTDFLMLISYELLCISFLLSLGTQVQA